MIASDGAEDKFYTRPEVARHVVGLIPGLSEFAEIIEPSAGAGAFLDALPPHAIGYDIAPERDGIRRADWLETRLTPKNGILVGNPPFGKRSSLAKAFIRHGIGSGFETIAFILPETFRKLSAQRAFPPDWRLTVQEPLPDDVFVHPDQGPVRIPCVFQVWTRTPGDLNLRAHAPAQPAEYEFLPRGDARADLCLNGNSGRVRDPEQITNPKAEHYIRIVRGGDATRARLAALPLSFHSSVSGGVAWVSKAEINAAWWAA